MTVRVISSPMTMLSPFLRGKTITADLLEMVIEVCVERPQRSKEAVI
jgi:hypothetical protein